MASCGCFSVDETGLQLFGVSGGSATSLASCRGLDLLVAGASDVISSAIWGGGWYAGAAVLLLR